MSNTHQFWPKLAITLKLACNKMSHVFLKQIYNTHGKFQFSITLMIKFYMGYSLPLTELAAQTEFSQVEKFVEAEQSITMA